MESRKILKMLILNLAIRLIAGKEAQMSASLPPRLHYFERERYSLEEFLGANVLCHCSQYFTPIVKDGASLVRI